MNYSFKYNNSIINDSTTIANKFNDYFVNVGLNLAKKIPIIDTTPTSYLKGNYNYSFFINPVVEQDVVDIIKTLPNKRPGAVGLLSHTMCHVVDSIAYPLTHIYMQFIFFNRNYTKWAEAW